MELYDFLKELQESDDEYLQFQATKIKKYISEFESNIIPENLCRSYIQDIKDLIELDNIRDRIKNKALAQKAIEELTKLFMKGIASAVKGVI